MNTKTAQQARDGLRSVLDHSLTGGATKITRNGQAVALVVPMPPDAVIDVFDYAAERWKPFNDLLHL